MAKKIDYWIEHPAERGQASKDYALSAQDYRIEQCVHAAERMFLEAIDDARRG